MSRPTNQPQFRLIATVVALVLVAVACGSDGDSELAAEPSIAPSTEAADEPAADLAISAGLAVDDVSFTNSGRIDFATIAEGIEQGPVYGDPTATAHGSFMRFQPGAIVPDHYYSNALRGVVVLGEISNPTTGEPSTEATQTPGGYFSWPAQAEHVTECVDARECHLFIFQDGPFELSLSDGTTPPAPAVDATVSAGLELDEVVFNTVDDIDFVELLPGVEQGAAYGDPTSTAHGSFMRFAPGASVPSHYYSRALRGVVIEGRVANPTVGEPSTDEPQGRGSYFSFTSEAEHVTTCVSDTACLFFVYQDGPFEITFLE